MGASCAHRDGVLTIDGTCDLKRVPVTQDIRDEFSKWLERDGTISPKAPNGAAAFLRRLSLNNRIIMARCAEGAKET